MGNKNIKGTVFEIERFAVNDGPGIRTIVFLKGCPLRCAWCANPESQSAAPQIMYWKTRCMGCRNCIDACPENALSWNGTQIVINREICDLCGQCADKCNSEALTLIGREYTVPEIMDIITRDEVFYRKSGGGITFSGGEVFFQTEFLTELAGACKEKGYHTCIETSGFTKWENLESVLPVLDLVMMDLKCMDDNIHRKMTGVSNNVILENFKNVARSGTEIVARIPVITGVNDNDENFRLLAEFLKENAPGCRIDLLPYHTLGVTKYERLNKEYTFDSMEPPDNDKMIKFKSYLESRGFKVSIGG